MPRMSHVVVVLPDDPVTPIVVMRCEGLSKNTAAILPTACATKPVLLNEHCSWVSCAQLSIALLHRQARALPHCHTTTPLQHNSHLSAAVDVHHRHVLRHDDRPLGNDGHGAIPHSLHAASVSISGVHGGNMPLSECLCLVLLQSFACHRC